MRRARFAFVVIACAGGLGGGACGPDLPERMWRSENVRYFSRATDDTVCPAILDELEEHGAVIADALGIGRTIVSYYKFDGADDYLRNAECGAGAGACASNATVRSSAAFDTHELIHAYLAQFGRPPALLTEGAAVALSCGRYPRPTGSWRDAFAAERLSLDIYRSGGWLVGYLLRMFRATWLVNLYRSVAVNASADEFAAVFSDIYGMSLDDVWAAAISTPQAPLRCPWECEARPLVADGDPHPLTAACGSGSVLRSLDLPAGGVTRWRIDGDGWFFLRSCDGNEEPAISISGLSGAGGLWAPLGAGKYFVDALVEPGGTPTLTVDTSALANLSSIDCATAPVIPDDLEPFGALSLFYPSSVGPRFTGLADGNDRTGLLVVLSDGPAAAASLCASCDTQTCRPANVSVQLPMSSMPPGMVVSVPPGPALTVWLQWF